MAQRDSEKKVSGRDKNNGGEDRHFSYVRKKALAAQQASRHLVGLSTVQKNEALEAISSELERSIDGILAANARDMEAGERAGLGTRLDRLLLTPERIESIRAAIDTVRDLPDPVGMEIDASRRPNGMQVRRVRCPLGVVGIIYEARPNVTVDASVICLKTGNAVVLKGGSDAIESNRAITEAIRRALERAGLPSAAVQLLDSTERAVTGAFLQMRGLIDVIIPRGSLELIRFTQDNAKVPVIETGASVVHAYVDEEVDVNKAVDLIVNAKTRRVSICGALDTLLLHSSILEEVGVPLSRRLAECDPPVEVRADERAYPVFADAMDAEYLKPLDALQDFDTEYLDYKMAVGTVDSMEEALAHIEAHSLKHTEAIYTTNSEKAERFMRSVDAACVMHNVSTQFVDGAEFGLGAEIGISTQKLHVRGPFALEGLTGMKWEIRGDGQTRP
ncbi:MAG: glutamate-5-semialdehyde dehydrogenase [SAR324 cluster bacterium]|nr:glutamate-5-semialdehyde dehydrogenase [SAR324 cluster bacterium]